MTDEAGKATALTYNAFGSPDEKYLVSVKDPLNNTTAYTRNMLGSITKITQGTLSRTYAYSTKNFLTSETHPENGTTTYTRDNVGNRMSKTDALGTRHFIYDKLNRLTKITYGAETIDFIYDKADNRTSMLSPSATMNYTYDAANRLTQKTATIAGRTYTTRYTYDGNDNVTNIFYPSGRTVGYTYNGNNQATSASWFEGGISNVTYYTTGSSIGLPRSLNGLITNITYSNRNLTTRITSGTVFDLSYGYDSRGNTTSLTDYLNSFSKTPTGIINYTYTSNRLASTTGSESLAYTYNMAGYLTNTNWQGINYGLSYDMLGNIRTYSINGTATANYTYDGDGMRVVKTTNGRTVVYHHGMDSNILSETDGAGNLIADYIYLNGKLVVKAEPTAFYFYHTDPAGTPMAMTDLSGSVVWRADYEPFGEEQITLAGAENNKQFVGKEKDKETGLYYFGARYMNDKIGRFISPDPVGPVDERTGKVNEKMLLNPQRLNRYAYGLNNSYRYMDPDGQTPWDIPDYFFFAQSAYKFHNEPSWSNAGNLALDTVGLLPIVPSLGMIKRVGKVIDKAHDSFRAAEKLNSYLNKVVHYKSGKTIQGKLKGGFAQANKDFDELVGDAIIKEYPGNIRSATLPDGTSISVRPSSTGEKPTVQITPSEGKQIKVRYDD